MDFGLDPYQESCNCIVCHAFNPRNEFLACPRPLPHPPKKNRRNEFAGPETSAKKPNAKRMNLIRRDLSHAGW